jgi:catechol 1,2-dioxygenase
VYRDREGSQGTILGPYYLPGAPLLEAPFDMPARPGEQGDRVVLSGRVITSDGNPLAGALLDIWHADANGLYSGFADELPEGILRGKLVSDEQGRYELRTVLPAPYTVPHDGPTGQMIAAAGWHPWRPAHIHLIVSAAGYEPLTTQLYIDSSDYLDDDVASAVKDELVVHPQPRESDTERGIDGPHLQIEYDFVLAPARTPAAVV